MVIHCLNFGSLWWLRPGEKVSDPLRYTVHAAAFNTTGFVTRNRERRSWHVAGVVRVNLAVHRVDDDTRVLEGGSYECSGLERRGAWNRLLLGRRLNGSNGIDKVLLCARSDVVGRICFDTDWHADQLQVVAASAHSGSQETLLLATPGAQFQTNAGIWEVSWQGLWKH